MLSVKEAPLVCATCIDTIDVSLLISIMPIPKQSDELLLKGFESNPDMSTEELSPSTDK